MPRKNLIRSNILPYHVTGRTNNREHFHLPLEQVWKIFESECLAIHLLHGFEFHSLILMPNHFHLMITTPESDLGTGMCMLLSNVTKKINKLSGRSGHVFGGPYYWSIIESGRYFGHAYKYVYRNPVRAGLCEKVEDYPFSTLHGRIGLSKLSIPLCYTRAGMEVNIPDANSVAEWLDWLNNPFPQEAEELIRQSMRRNRLRRILDRETRTPVSSLEGLL